MNQRPVAFITGASRGIGAETAKEFVRNGYDCAIIADDSVALESVAGELRQLGGNALTLAGDLCDLDFARASAESCFQTWGRIDVLVNNAAWREIVTMRQMELPSWEKTLRVCLTSPAFLAKWCATHMEPAGRGVILNISSIQSKFVAGISPAYVAAKGGLDALTYELATLYGPSGIRVLGLNLGAIDTGLSRDYAAGETDRRLRAMVEDMTPLRRFGQPEEIARCVVMFAGEGASYMTGACIDIDGGWSHQCSPYSIKQLQFPNEFAARREATPDV